jgi:L-methionine (R)-S-oxide reductase
MSASNDKKLAEVAKLVEAVPDPVTQLAVVMHALREMESHHYWVGVYFLGDEMLEVGPYSGPLTDHRRIPVGRGVCGTAIAEGRNQVVADVSKLGNYLACNLDTKSEIVVLVRDGKTVLGQIDVDSRKLNAFDNVAEDFFEKVGQLILPAFRKARLTYLQALDG